VHTLWVRVRDAIAGTLDSISLADLVPVPHITLDPRPAAKAAAPSTPAQPEPTLTGAIS
jgi:hypothetical protein